MRVFLYWSCAMVCGFNGTAIYFAYGGWAAAGAFVAGVYVMAAQYLEGRDYS